MTDRISLIAGAGLGAGLMYLLDPDRGRRRRALARDKAIHLLHRSDDAVSATARDVSNRLRGVVAEARALVSREGDVPDQVLAERVRAELGHYCSHPGAIEVSAAGGRVTLRGPILARELDVVVRAVGRTRGVREVDSRLEVHQQPDGVPGLQAGVGRAGRRFELMQSRWSPTARMLVGAGGAALLVSASARRDLVGSLLGLLGAGLAARAATNLEMKRLLGVGGGRRAVDVHKSLDVDAPLERVFAFWRNYENFPRFMSNVREVRDLGEGRSHWTVAGPAGATVGWEAEITQLVPNEVIAWRTVPGSSVAHAGVLRFQPTAQGGTRLDIRMSYNPPAGALGHVVAVLFGDDPKSEIDADLVRMKTLLETGQPPHDAAQPLRAAEDQVH
jgi:uncharacterized membrane protein